MVADSTDGLDERFPIGECLATARRLLSREPGPRGATVGIPAAIASVWVPELRLRYVSGW